MIGDWRLWLATGVVFACLWVFWLMLNFTFDLIEQAHERLRKQAEAERLEDAKATRGKVI